MMESYTARNKGSTAVILILIAGCFFILIRYGYRYSEYSRTRESSDPVAYQLLERRAVKGRNAHCLMRISYRGSVSKLEISSDELSGIDIGTLPEVYESPTLGVFSLWELKTAKRLTAFSFLAILLLSIVLIAHRNKLARERLNRSTGRLPYRKYQGRSSHS